MRRDCRSCLFILHAIWFLLAYVETPVALGQERSEQAASDAATSDEQPPALSIDTIYGPEKRYDYDGPAAPPHRWITRDGDSLLAIKRDSDWRVRYPASGDEAKWDLPEQLVASIKSLPQVSTEQAEQAADSLLRSPDSDLERSLLRIDNGYAIVGTATQAKWIVRDAAQWRNVTLSPTGTHVAYTADNDLHVLEIATGASRALTSNGSATQLNGVLDWAYQEEIYGRGNFKGFWWSPDGSKMAFLRLSIRDVYEYTVADSATPRGRTLVTRYPKVGDPIAEAELWVADLQGSLQALHQVGPETRENLIVRVSWHPDSDKVAYQVTDRVQSWLELRLADVRLESADSLQPNRRQSESQLLLKDSSAAWVEVLGEPIWLNDEDFLWLSDQPAGRRRLWRINRLGKERVAVTPETFDVRSLGKLSQDQQTIFIEGDAERGTRGQQLYLAKVSSASARGAGQPGVSGFHAAQTLRRLTSGEGWHNARVDPNQQWMVDSFSALDTPPTVRLVPIPHEGEDAPAGVSDGHYILQEAPALPADWVEPQWIELTVADGIELPGYYLRPQNVEGPVPVLIETYGGPLAPSAVDRWGGTRFLYQQFLVQQGIAVMVVDNRSSAGRGIAHTWSIHRQMGVLELCDLLAFVEWLKGQSWADAEKIGVRGWSFGGYLTAYALTHSKAFAAGVAGGSPTDWRNYDAIYTERYMGLPEQNPDGYERTSVLNAANNLHGRLLLVHGELDDNVHLANTLQLTAALQKAGKQFDLMIYPGAAHGIHHPHQVHHLMTLVTDFLRRHLDP